MGVLLLSLKLVTAAPVAAKKSCVCELFFELTKIIACSVNQELQLLHVSDFLKQSALSRQFLHRNTLFNMWVYGRVEIFNARVRILIGLTCIWFEIVIYFLMLIARSLPCTSAVLKASTLPRRLSISSVVVVQPVLFG